MEDGKPLIKKEVSLKSKHKVNDPPKREPKKFKHEGKSCNTTDNTLAIHEKEGREVIMMVCVYLSDPPKEIMPLLSPNLNIMGQLTPHGNFFALLLRLTQVTFNLALLLLKKVH